MPSLAVVQYLVNAILAEDSRPGSPHSNPERVRDARARRQSTRLIHDRVRTQNGVVASRLSSLKENEPASVSPEIAGEPLGTEENGPAQGTCNDLIALLLAGPFFLRPQWLPGNLYTRGCDLVTGEIFA